MPRFNRTGPDGQGPMTGRRLGLCTGNVNFETMNPFWGRGLRHAGGYGEGIGMGRGRGRGRGLFRNHPVYTNQSDHKEDEIQLLKNHARYFEKALKEIQDRINEIEDKKNSKD